MTDRSQVERWQRVAAGLVHVFTGLGTILAFLAVLALGAREFEAAFAWLFAALIVDGLDGPLARWLNVGERLPRFSGERLDLIIDYLTFVFIPVLALRWGGFLPGWWGLMLAAIMLLSALYHFSDLQSKTDSHYFVGFPAVWNLVAFYIFAFAAPLAVTSLIILVCAGLTFVPLRAVHPMRVTAFRAVTLAILTVGFAAAATVIATGFPAGPVTQFILLAAVLYMSAVPIVERLRRRT